MKAKINNMEFLTGSLAVLVLGLLVIATAGTHASSSAYSFTVRGIVTEVNSTTVTAHVTYASAANARADMLSNAIAFRNNSTSKLYKQVLNSTTKKYEKKRVKIGNVAVDQEVVIKGTRTSSGQYNISDLIINVREFTVTGKVTGRKVGDKELTIAVKTSNYKPTQFEGKDVKMYYNADTDFISDTGKTLAADEVQANNQTVKVKGKITGSDRWELSSVHE